MTVPSSWTLFGSLLLAFALAACSGASSATQADQATVTPLVDASPVPTLAPTSTLAPTRIAISMLPEVETAKASLAADQFSDAVDRLLPIQAVNPTDSELRELLARAYLGWGQQRIASGEGDPAQRVVQALGHFSDGLAIAEEGSPSRPSLQAAFDQAQSVVGGSQELARIQAALAAGETSGDLQGASERLIASWSQIYSANRDYPTLRPLYVQLLIAAAQIYEAGAQGLPSTEAVERLQQALGACEQALAIDETSGPAKECRARTSSAIEVASAPPTRTPRPAPTTRPTVAVGRIQVSLRDRNERAGCIALQVRGVNTSGWTLTIDGLNLGGSFDSSGNVAVCGLPDHAVTFTIRSRSGPVPGGSGIPAQGRDIFVAQ